MEVMTPEQRFERIERVLGYFVREGRRWRVRSREQDEKINILIHTQMETSEQIARNSERVSEQISKMSERVDRTSEHIDKLAADVAANHAIHNKEMADLRKSQELTDKALRAFIDHSLRKRRSDDSSD
jgi:methyl-accepting chemotaxis protein